MTRINVLPPELMLDEWVAAHCKESLRPINNVLRGKYVSKPYGGKYRLGTGHELWGAYYGKFISDMWIRYKQEWSSRGGKGFDFDPSIKEYPVEYCNDYTPTPEDYLINIERLKERFLLRGKPYHFKGQLINCVESFNTWLLMVCDKLSLQKYDILIKN